MDEQTWALIGAVLSFVSLIVGVLWSRNVARKAQRVQLESGLAIDDLIDDLERKDLDPETRRKVTQVIRTRSIPATVGISIAEEEGVNSAGSPRTGSQKRTVEVERQDGSRATLEVDPSDAVSVRRFLDDARRVDAERVVSVQRLPGAANGATAERVVSTR
jgi:hypothetical protein